MVYGNSAVRSQQASAARYAGLANSIQKTTAARAADAGRYQGQADRIFSTAGNLTPTPTPANPTPLKPISVNPNPKPLGQIDTTTTDPASGRKPKPYPTEPRPLSAAELGALADRRLAVDSAYQEALAARERGEGSARVSSLAQRQMIDKDFTRTSQDFLGFMGGRGLARSPMFAGKGMRRMQQDREGQYGEVESNLTNELSALEEMVNRARIERDMETARISQDEAMMRSNPFDYLLAANQYL